MLKYLRNLFIALDQFVNALCAGNPDVTISARTGFLARHSRAITRFYWKIYEQIIDFAFYPLDGPGHCEQAYQKEDDEIRFVGSDLLTAVLGLVIVVSCILIAVVNWSWLALSRLFGIAMPNK